MSNANEMREKKKKRNEKDILKLSKLQYYKMRYLNLNTLRNL